MVRFAARVPAGGPPTLERSARYRSLVWSLRVPRYFGAGAKNLARARPVSFYAAANRYHYTKQSWKRLEDYIYYRPKIVRIAGRIRRNDTIMPQLSLLVLAIAGSSLYRGSGSSISRKASGRRSGVSPRTDSSADLPKILFAVKAFTIQLYCKNVCAKRARAMT